MNPYDLLGSDVSFSAYGLQWDINLNRSGDIRVAHGLDNLVQALIIRFNTRLGELSPLGHPDYGSRLPELIGLPNNQTTRNLVKLYALECVKQEARVQEVLDLKITTTPEQGKVMIHMSVLPAGETDALNLVFPFYLNQ